MGVRLSIEGSESIKLQETSITGIEFGADIPHDSNARSTDLGSTVLITGKILAAVDGETADDTSKLAKWSLVPAEKSDCADPCGECISDCASDHHSQCVRGGIRRGFYG